METPEPLLRELIGGVLRAERHRQGRTLAQVAAASGVSMQHLSDVERGRKDPSSELLAAIAGALGLGVLDLTRRITEASADTGTARPRVLELRSLDRSPAPFPPARHHGATAAVRLAA